MKKYCKELDVNFVSVNDTEKAGGKSGCLWGCLFLIIIIVTIWVIGALTDPCRKDLEQCYCNSLAIASQSERVELQKEIVKRGYVCNGRHKSH